VRRQVTAFLPTPIGGQVDEIRMQWDPRWLTASPRTSRSFTRQRETIITFGQVSISLHVVRNWRWG